MYMLIKKWPQVTSVCPLFQIGKSQKSAYFDKQTDWCFEMSHLLFPSLAFRFIYSVDAQIAKSIPGQKNRNAESISLQPPNQIISESVCVVFLCEVLRAHAECSLGSQWAFRTHFYCETIWDGVSLSLCFKHCYNQKTTHLSVMVSALIEERAKLTVRVLHHKHSTHYLSASSMVW